VTVSACYNACWTDSTPECTWKWVNYDFLGGKGRRACDNNLTSHFAVVSDYHIGLFVVPCGNYTDRTLCRLTNRQRWLFIPPPCQKRSVLEVKKLKVKVTQTEERPDGSVILDSRCLSVRLFVTLRYCVETAKHMIKCFSYRVARPF